MRELSKYLPRLADRSDGRGADVRAIGGTEEHERGGTPVTREVERLIVGRREAEVGRRRRSTREEAADVADRGGGRRERDRTLARPGRRTLRRRARRPRHAPEAREREEHER